MSQQLRQIKTRIRSIEGSWKITRAMEMVSMAKYKMMDQPLTMTRAYFQKLESMTFNLIGSVYARKPLNHPFLSMGTCVDQTVPIGLVVMTAETGLCGIYNDRVLKAADKFIKENGHRKIHLYLMGRKAVNHYKKQDLPIIKVFPAFHGKLKNDFHSIVYAMLTKDYIKNAISQVYVVYTQFFNAMRQEVNTVCLMPFDVPLKERQKDILLELDEENGINTIIDFYISNRLRLMIMESLISEYSSRMVAMKAAKDNAKELSEELTLMRNKLRQATITREVIEIISSSEALKG